MADYSDLDPTALRASLSDGTRLKKSITTDLYTGGTPSAANQVKPSIMYADGTLKESITYADGTLKPSWLIAGSGGGGAVAEGKVLQVQQVTAGKATTSAVIALDDTIPQISEGFEILSLAFTPLSDTSTIHIDIHTGCGGDTNKTTTAALFVDSNADAVSCSPISAGAGSRESIDFGYKVASATTSARTYSVRFGVNSGSTANYDPNADDNGGLGLLSTMIITEVEA